uniref:SMP-30/gluconolactonase/LRE family protein n=1 Tax=Ningiella ruwaisensis TaxID=2364274 RepID=UPI0010A09745|nr:SMP-30/gluconolactonase/LRE family protein [Ningiella ruwaisensis]
MKKILGAIIILLVLLLGILYAISPVRPVAWQPDANAGLKNMFMRNNEADSVQIVGQNRLPAPEDITVSDNGVLFTGLENGDIVSFPVSDPANITVIANTGGRPLGVRIDKQGDLIVSDAIKGLLKVSLDGTVTTLVDSFQGKPLLLVDHHDIAENGDIYFSNASSRYGMETFLYDFIEASATGEVYRYSPDTGETIKLMDGLFFANGIALGPNDDYLLVTETGKSRILRYDLAGKNAGETSIFATNLPGMPDNISFNDEGIFWVGMVSLRDWRVENLANYPSLRRIVGALPLKWLEPTEHYGFFVGFNEYGRVVANYQSPAKYTSITSVYEHEDKLYIGSLKMNGVAVLSL